MTNEELVLQYQNGNESAFTELAENFEKNIKFYTRKYRFLCVRSYLDEKDLFQEGIIGLHNAVKMYKNSDIAFVQYANIAIKRRIYRALQRTFEKKNKRDINEQVIHITSLDAPLTETDENFNLMTSLSDDSRFNNVNEIIQCEYIKTLHGDLMELLSVVFDLPKNNIRLNQRKKELLILKYGLNGVTMAVAELADKFNTSVNNIYYMENSALLMIRKSPYGKNFMKVYGHGIIEHIENKKEYINLYQAPQIVFLKIENLTEMINSFEKFAI